MHAEWEAIGRDALDRDRPSLAARIGNDSGVAPSAHR
jgi:hypothetical protein